LFLLLLLLLLLLLAPPHFNATIQADQRRDV